METIFGIGIQVVSGLLVVGATAGAAALGGIVWVRRVKICDPNGEPLNSGFHNYFCRVIEDAKDEILLVGEGFGYSSAEGGEYAAKHLAKLEKAMGNGVKVTRIQTERPLSRKWAVKLAELLEGYPSQFSLFVLRNIDEGDVASVCVVDPNRTRSVVELLSSVNQEVGNESHRVAGTGIFIHGRQAYAKNMAATIRTLRDSKRSVKITTKNMLMEFVHDPTEDISYFAFGSNMSKYQMNERCPSASFVGTATLRGYEIVFNRIGDHRDGGVASVTTAQDPNRSVRGALWKISRGELDRLDEHEVKTSYHRISVMVFDDSSEELVQSEMYVGLPQPGPIAPDPEYLQVLVNAAIAIGLPQEYVDYLAAFGELRN